MGSEPPLPPASPLPPLPPVLGPPAPPPWPLALDDVTLPVAVLSDGEADSSPPHAIASTPRVHALVALPKEFKLIRGATTAAAYVEPSALPSRPRMPGAMFALFRTGVGAKGTSMTLALLLHLFLLGLWLGCVMVEGVLEFFARRDRGTEKKVAELHFWIDVLVEIPAFLGVLVTGLVLIDGHALSGLLLVKIAFGMAAIVVNALCVLPVVRRRFAAARSEEENVRRQSKWIGLAFVVGLPLGFAAMGLGLHRLGIL
jgi:hypothetical protein